MNEQRKNQIDRFKEAARALGCDEDEAAFDEKLKGIARQRNQDPRKSEENSGGRIDASEGQSRSLKKLGGKPG